MTAFIKRGDLAQDFLVPFLKETETILRNALRTYDPAADCRVVAAADLCIPHDVIRLAGGFATGCFLEWQCSTPVVPVDTTMNIDTSSIFLIDGDITGNFTEMFFRNLIEETAALTSYVWNFDKGNHFISICRRRSDGKHALIFHSNEKEFKYQLNGLVPVEGNWFWSDIKTHSKAGRYIRLLVGDKAVSFAKLAKMLEDYNLIRHQYFALRICGMSAKLTDQQHHHHYFMPTSSSAALGVYLCQPQQQVPIFSKLGRPIISFAPARGGSNSIAVDGQERILVPHGWGKTTAKPLELRWEKDALVVNGRSYPNVPKASIGKHPDLKLREFSDDPASPGSFVRQIESACPGVVCDVFDQLLSYSQAGLVDHRSSDGL